MRIQLECPQCRHTMRIPESEEQYGLMCPECHCQKMRRPKKMRRKNAIETLRPMTVRSLIGAVLCFLIGPPLLLLGYNNMFGRGTVLYARLFAFGTLLVISGFVSLGTGLWGLHRDLTEGE